jgi:hypothetical protein
VAEFINKSEAPGYTKDFAVKVFALQRLMGRPWKRRTHNGQGLPGSNHQAKT